MTLFEFQQDVFVAALASPICDIPAVRRLTPRSISMRIHLASGGFINAFYNEQTGTTAFALIRQGRRVFGVDNTGGWHVHPFTEPNRHDPLPDPMSFADFVAEIERQ